MGKIEERGQVTRKRIRMQHIVLASLYGAGAVSLMLFAPNALRLLRHVDPLIEEKTNPHRRLSQALSKMHRSGHVRRTKGGAYELTEKGKTQAERQYVLQEYREQKRWDGRWRLVMFDIWERRRKVRDKLRILLERVGFQRLQDSVWIYPYDCEEVIAFIRTELKLGGGIQYFVGDGIENDSRLKEHFGLH